MTKILIIEDETDLREEVIAWLSFEGYEVIGAEDGVIGLEAATRFLPDLIVCDVMMPRLDGYSVLLELHSRVATVGIPFIFLTAKADYEDVRKGMNLGADDYVAKPFTRQELLTAIQARLEKKQLVEQETLRRMEQLQEALTFEHEQRLLKSKLVSMFSHDFRNPLTVVMSSITLLRDYDGRLSDERRFGRMNAIIGSTRLLLQMLDDMLVVAQMDTGHLTVHLEPVRVEQLLREIVQEFHDVSGENYQFHFYSNFPATVLTDVRLIRQIATNLISNAIKYSPAMTTIEISLESRQNDYLLIVKDQGIGIPKNDQAQLFAAFKRGSNVGKIVGTGLGLAIVKQAADLLGGTIQVSSQIDVGTTMTVILPSLG